MKTSYIVIGILILIAIGGIFLYSQQTTSQPLTQQPASQPPVSQSTKTAKIVNFSFQPTSLTVTSGTVVTWTNNDSMSHTVTADDGSFDSGPISPGGTFSHTFANVGTQAYHCKFHSSMHGSVIVTK